jgi:hypothetical protein
LSAADHFGGRHGAESHSNVLSAMHATDFTVTAATFAMMVANP